MGMVTKKKYNFKDLEDKVNRYYFSGLDKNLDSDKSSFFKSVYNLAYAILEVSKYKVDFDTVAHDYAALMYERVFILGDLFYTKSDRIPFTSYIRLNIKNLVYPKDSNLVYKDVLEDLKYIVDSESVDLPISNVSSNDKIESLGDELYSALLKFYDNDTIKQKLHISLDLIFDTDFQPISRNMPKDLQVFSITLICIAKRIATDNRLQNIKKRDVNTISNALEASLRSSSFLAIMSENPNYIPLFLSLDIDSIYRLATVSGGTRVTVPSLRYLSNIMNTSVVASSVILDSSKRYVSYRDITKISKNFKIKSSNGSNVSRVSLQKSISKALDIYDTLGHDEKSNPILQTLGYSVKAIEKLADSATGESRKIVLEYLDNYSLIIDRLRSKVSSSTD